MRPSTITIDGPAASGKSTIGELLAQRLGYLYFDTGAMYRAVTWMALEQGIPIEDERAVGKLAERVRIKVKPPTVDDGRQYTVLVDGEDVTWAIRRPEVDASVSAVSAYPRVREEMVRQQRLLASEGGIVMVGRDIGSVVLPDADLKIYLDATVEERARRRWRQMQQRRQPAVYKDVLLMMRRRDQIDSSREVSPLRAAKDAEIINTTELDIEEVLETVMRVLEERDPI